MKETSRRLWLFVAVAVAATAAGAEVDLHQDETCTLESCGGGAQGVHAGTASDGLSPSVDVDVAAIATRLDEMEATVEALLGSIRAIRVVLGTSADAGGSTASTSRRQEQQPRVLPQQPQHHQQQRQGQVQGLSQQQPARIDPALHQLVDSATAIDGGGLGVTPLISDFLLLESVIEVSRGSVAWPPAQRNTRVTADGTFEHVCVCRPPERFPARA